MALWLEIALLNLKNLQLRFVKTICGLCGMKLSMYESELKKRGYAFFYKKDAELGKVSTQLVGERRPRATRGEEVGKQEYLL